jgi:hypothetical protein
LSQKVHVGVGTRQTDQLQVYGLSVYTMTKCVSNAGIIEDRFQVDTSTSVLMGMLAAANLLHKSPRLPPEVDFKLPTQTLVVELSNNSPIGVQNMIVKD